MTAKKPPPSGRPDAAPERALPVADIVPLRRSRRRCPVCGQTAVHAYRPFCSAACADRDLGRWLSESYRIPTNQGSDETPEEQ